MSDFKENAIEMDFLNNLVCRLCLKEVHDLIEIFSEQGTRLNIPTIIRQHILWYELKENDEFSKYICPTCWWKLENFHVFYTSIENTHKEYLLKSVEISEPEVIVDLRFFEEIPTTSECTEEKPQTRSKKRSSIEIKKEDEQIREYCKMECEICPIKFNYFSEVKVHYRDVHNSNGYISCCNKKLFKRVRVLEHILRHLDPSAFKCDICFKIFSDKPGLLNHMDGHKDITERTFKCLKCYKSYAKKYQLDQHQIRHITEDEKTFICSVENCGKAFATKSILVSHRKGVHENAFIHICDICAKTFKSKIFFEKHRIQHSDVLPKIQCPECGKWLKHEHSLRSHMARHAESSVTWTCNICDKQSPSKGALQSHKRFVHTLDRLFKCTICDKAFKKALTLKEHISAIHTGELLYQCSFCTKTFNSAANMHSHRKRMHLPEWEEARKNKM